MLESRPAVCANSGYPTVTSIEYEVLAGFQGKGNMLSTWRKLCMPPDEQSLLSTFPVFKAWVYLYLLLHTTAATQHFTVPQAVHTSYKHLKKF